MTDWATWQPADEMPQALDYVFTFLGPYGHSKVTFTLDNLTPNFGGVSPTDIGLIIWQRLFAPRTCRDTELFVVECNTLLGFPVGTPRRPEDGRGMIPDPSAPLERSPTLVSLTGHMDGGAKRRYHIPGTPARWQSSGMLNTEGESQLLTMGRAMVCAWMDPAIAFPFRMGHYIRPDPLSPDSRAQRGGWRFARYLRVCQLTSRAQTDL